MLLQWIDTCASQWYLVLLYWLNVLWEEESEIGNQAEKQCNRIPEWQERRVQGEVWLGVRGRASLLAAFISWVWKFRWACSVDGLCDARRLVIASALEFSIQKHFWACQSLGLAWRRPFCQFLHQFHRARFLPSVSGCHQSSGIVCRLCIIARNLTLSSKLWMVSLWSSRTVQTNSLT